MHKGIEMTGDESFNCDKSYLDHRKHVTFMNIWSATLADSDIKSRECVALRLSSIWKNIKASRHSANIWVGELDQHWLR